MKCIGCHGISFRAEVKHSDIVHNNAHIPYILYLLKYSICLSVVKQRYTLVLSIEGLVGHIDGRFYLENSLIELSDLATRILDFSAYLTMV